MTVPQLYQACEGEVLVVTVIPLYQGIQGMVGAVHLHIQKTVIVGLSILLSALSK